MRETLRILRGLQELDEDLYRVKDELRRLPKERDRRREQLDHELARLRELEHRGHEVRTRIKEIEDMTTGQRQRVRKLENESAKSTDQALIAAYTHEIRSIKRDIGEAEEEGLALVEKADAIQAEADELRAKIEELEADFRVYSENVDEEVRAAEVRRMDLEAQRTERIQSQVAPSVLETYEKLLDAREGHAMALLDGLVCQGCYVSVPNNLRVRLARGTELVSCPSCQRLLYLPDAQ